MALKDWIYDLAIGIVQEASGRLIPKEGSVSIADANRILKDIKNRMSTHPFESSVYIMIEEEGYADEFWDGVEEQLDMMVHPHKYV